MALWSQTLIPTLREAPSDAEIASHKLLIRAGLVRKLAGGLYSYLPLGLRALRKIEAIVRDEMNRAGAQEVFLPALQPADLWKRGPRYDAARRVMFTAASNNRRDAELELVLGPTHEEVITELVAGTLNSYRHLPKTFYQIQTKFRDEIRPRFGLMRAREFLMKDAYSFDVSDDAATASYQAMYEAYRRIFARIGLKAMIVEADTGVMGGSFSHEFSVPCDIGESEIVYTEDGAYAAAIEKAATQPEPRDNPASCPAPEKFATPGALTIQALVQNHRVAARDQIKTLVYLCDSKLHLFLVRGDHELSEAKAAACGFEELRPATAAEIHAALGAHPGSLGAVGKLPGAIRGVFADLDLQGQRGMATGANEDGFHFRNIDVARDIPSATFKSLRLAREGELAPSGKPVLIRRAIEVGHVFKLGTKYSEALGAMFLDESGKSNPMVMGCYGIGVSRSLQAIIEQHHDENGILWPAAVAPYQVLITLLDRALESEARALAETLEARGMDCLIDDRDERPGVKFKDADLVGFPVRVTAGEKSWKAGGFEIKARAAAKAEIAPANGAAEKAAALLKG